MANSTVDQWVRRHPPPTSPKRSAGAGSQAYGGHAAIGRPSSARLRWGLLAALLAVSASHAAPTLRTIGVHLVSGETSRWLGPGGDPAWAADGSRLYLNAAHGPLTGPPYGQLYSVEAATRRAQGLGEAVAAGAMRVSPSGRLLAVLRVDGARAAVQVLEATGARPVCAPIALGPVGPGLADSFAWLPEDKLLYAVGSGERAQTGLFELNPATSVITPKAVGAGGDGLWPSPDGRAVAVRVGPQVAVLGLVPDWTPAGDAGPTPPESPPVAVAWTGSEPGRIDGVRWDPDSKSLWIAAVREADLLLAHRNLAGGELGRVAADGIVRSRVGWGDDTAVAVTDGRVVAVSLADGAASLVATIAPGVPIDPGTSWPAPRPCYAPDGRTLAVSLGRTDRWGITDSDLSQVADTNAQGNTVSCTRRGRNVGPSGVVFDSGTVAFAGRGKPVPDGRVATDPRPGGFRWERPSPARWVVLHHTATQSDSGSLNALTANGNGDIARLYSDITPGRLLPGEPNTISVHYLVRRDGTVMQLVEERYIARHAGTGQWRNTGPIYDFNAETIGIEIVARGNDFTAAQVRNVGRLVADICRRNAIPLEHVAGTSFVEGVLYHRDFAGGLRGKPDPAGWPWEAMMASSQAYLRQTP